MIGLFNEKVANFFRHNTIKILNTHFIDHPDHISLTIIYEKI